MTAFNDGPVDFTLSECYLLIDEQGYLGRLWTEREVENMDIVYMDCEHSVCLWNKEGTILTCENCGLDCT